MLAIIARAVAASGPLRTTGGAVRALRAVAGPRGPAAAPARRPPVEGGALLLVHRPLSTVPEGLKYAASHEWAKVDGDVATVGITDHAQAELGDVVFVELPDVGTALDAGDTFGVVESVKAASDVYSPISGEVVEINEELVDEPAKVNSGAFSEGWMIKVKMTDGVPGELMDAAGYKASIEE